MWTAILLYSPRNSNVIILSLLNNRTLSTAVSHAFDLKRLLHLESFIYGNVG